MSSEVVIQCTYEANPSRLLQVCVSLCIAYITLFGGFPKIPCQAQNTPPPPCPYFELIHGRYVLFMSDYIWLVLASPF